MKKKIWIMNHYATNMFFNKSGRHYWFAQNLKKHGYEPTIFCAATRHNTEDYIETGKAWYRIIEDQGIPYVFVKSLKYKDNGNRRILNMMDFSRKLSSVTKAYMEVEGKPDVILASSVHPLTLLAGLHIAKKLGVPCICEVRDLWPESLHAYGLLKRRGFLSWLLYHGEKWIYKRAEALIMTWEGGPQYILDQGWNKHVDMEKVFHISNGVDLEAFDENAKEHRVEDPDLVDPRYMNFVYAGAIRKVNNLGILLDAAKILQEKHEGIRLLIYGFGDEKPMLEKRCQEEGIRNVLFKGRVEQRMVPHILTNAHANILHNSSTSLDIYGQSQNKLFEYLAAGRCVLQTYTTGYSILEKYQCGISAKVQTPEAIAEAILAIAKDPEKAREMGANARRAAEDYDIRKLTLKLMDVLENRKKQASP